MTHRSGLPSRLRSQQRVWKRQAVGGLEGDGMSAGQQDVFARSLNTRIGDGHRRQQRSRVRVERLLKNGFGVCDLDQLAQIHHRYPIGDMADN